MTTRIVLVDDHTLFRTGVRELLGKEPDLEVVGEASDGAEALALLARVQADVLLLDLSLPGGIAGARVAEAVRQRHPGVLIVVLTMHEDEYYLKELVKIGAMGYVLKQSTANELILAIRAACKGRFFLDPAMSRHVVPALGGHAMKQQPATDALTVREQEVCSLLAMGHTNAEVGAQLCISARTVETHRHNIMTKLGLRNRAELVRWALEHGLMTGPG